MLLYLRLLAEVSVYFQGVWLLYLVHVMELFPLFHLMIHNVKLNKDLLQYNDFKIY